jgi:peroxiredoxin
VVNTSPDFTLKDQEGNSVTLSEILKRQNGVIIAFYPKDFTPG